MMTFPMFEDQNAGISAMMFKKKPSGGSSSTQRKGGAPAAEFWTNELVRTFMRMQKGLNGEYDQYHKAGRDEEDLLRNDISKLYD